MDPEAESGRSGLCVTRAQAPDALEDAGAGSLDQIFTDLLSALKKVNEVLTDAKMALVHMDQPGDRPVALRELQDPCAPAVRRTIGAQD